MIVGGGFAGMMTAVELKRLGMHDFRMIEKGGDFGGTWYWNRYPGCQCDVESYTYLPLLEETGFMPTKRYRVPPRSSCHRLIGRQFELYPHALFQTEIAGAVWHDDEGRWLVTTSRDGEIRCKYFVTAGGILHKAKLPGIPGIDTFEGHAFTRADGITATPWLRHRTNGQAARQEGRHRRYRATAVQAVPQLAKYAEELYVFQRTPAAIGGSDNGPTDVEWFQSLQPGWHAERVENFTRCVTGEQPDVDREDGWTKVNWVNTQDASSPEHREELTSSISRSWRRSGRRSTRSSTTQRPPRSSSRGTASTANASPSTTSTCRLSTFRTCAWSIPTARASSGSRRQERSSTARI